MVLIRMPIVALYRVHQSPWARLGIFSTLVQPADTSPVARDLTEPIWAEASRAFHLIGIASARAAARYRANALVPKGELGTLSEAKFR